MLGVARITSFEPSTGNPSSEDRHVLIIDFWHPELSDVERAGLEYIYDLRNKFELGKVPFRQPKAKPEVAEEEEGQGLRQLTTIDLHFYSIDCCAQISLIHSFLISHYGDDLVYPAGYDIAQA